MTLEERVHRLELLLGLKRESNTGRLRWLLQTVASAYAVRPEDIIAPGRVMTFVVPRHVFCWLAFRAGYTSVAIGRVIRREHSGVRHAIACVEEYLDTDAAMRERVRRLAAAAGIELKEAA